MRLLPANGREKAVKQALRQLLSDFLSAILFLVVYAASGSLFAAAGIAVTAGSVQRLRRRARGAARAGAGRVTLAIEVEMTRAPVHPPGLFFCALM